MESFGRREVLDSVRSLRGRLYANSTYKSAWFYEQFLLDLGPTHFELIVDFFTIHFVSIKSFNSYSTFSKVIIAGFDGVNKKANLSDYWSIFLLHVISEKNYLKLVTWVPWFFFSPKNLCSHWQLFDAIATWSIKMRWKQTNMRKMLSSSFRI